MICRPSRNPGIIGEEWYAATATRRSTAKRPEAATHASTEWIDIDSAAKLVNRSKRSITKLARAGYIRRHKPPLLSALYAKHDVLKIAPPIT